MRSDAGDAPFGTAAVAGREQRQITQPTSAFFAVAAAVLRGHTIAYSGEKEDGHSPEKRFIQQARLMQTTTLLFS